MFGLEICLSPAIPVGGDAHYWSGGSFRVEQLDGTLGDLYSPADPIVLANGDVSMGNYTGASLHVLAGGSVTTGNISINATDTTGKTISPDNPNPFLARIAQANLSNGTTSMTVDGSARPTLDIRAGIDWNLLGGSPGNTDPGNNVANFNPNATSADITIGNIYIKAPDGLVFLTNQYQPNSSLPSGVLEIGTIRTDDDFVSFVGNSGAVIIDYRGGITVSDRIITSSGSGDGGDVTLITDGLISLDNSSILTRTLGTRQGGNIDIQTGSLFVSNGGQLNASTGGEGNAGNVTIEALNMVSFDGIGTSQFGSGVFSRVQEGAKGNGGNISISTGSLSVTNGARITPSTVGQGNAGNVTINARNRVSFDGQGSDGTPSGAYSLVNSLAEGNGGDIEIVAGSVFVTNGSVLHTATFGQGNAGNVTIKARDQVALQGQGSNPTNISSGVVVGAEGDGGNIEIVAGSVILTDRTWIDSRVAGKGNAGNVTIETRDGAILNNVGGENLTVMSGSTIISNGILNINSDTKLTNTSGDIILNDVTSNNLTVNSNGAILGQGILTINNNANFISNLANAGNVTVTNTKATTIGNSIIGGNFTLNSNRLVSQVPGEFLQVAGIISVNGSSSSSLVNTSSLPPPLTTLANGDVIINQVGTINLPANNFSGNLTVNSLSKAAVSFNSISNTSAITLNQPNSFGGTLRFNTTSDAIFVTGTPGITQSGSQIVSGTATFNAETGNISLNDPNNQFGQLAFTGNNVSIREADGTNLQTSTAIGNFNLTSKGLITQTGLLNIGGDTSLIATLPNAGNVTITNRNATILGNSLIGGNFTIDSGGAISQVPGELLQVAGNTAIANPSSQPVLDINGNIIPRLTLPNGDVIITKVGTVDLNAETFSGNLTVNSLANAVEFTGIYDRPGIILNQPGNSFSGTLRIKTDAPTTVVATGTPGITQSGSLEVNGTATFNAENGNIILNGPGNQFGNLAFNGNIISIRESDATNLLHSTVTGNLNLTSGNGITQSSSLNVTGKSSFTSLLPNANIILTGNNHFTGEIGFNSGENSSVTLFNTLATTQLGLSHIFGNLTISSGGNITQTGVLRITELTTLNSGNSDIILNQDNDFNTVVINSGRKVDFNEINRLNLGNSSVYGSLTVNASGDITTEDIFSPSGVITLTSTNGDINTTAGEINTFSLGSGGAITLVANGDITTGSISSRGGSIAGGDITLTSNGKIFSAHGFINSRTIGSGKAGNINIQAQSVLFSDGTIVSASTFSTGSGGNINITAPSISFTEGSQLRTTTLSNGNGGNITVTAPDLVELIDIVGNLRSGFFADTLGTGSAGNITVNTERLLVENGATITASTFGGQGGNIIVNSSNTELIGVGTITSGQILPSALATVTFTDKNAGNLIVNTNNFIAQAGGLASASTLGSGKGGRLTVNASNSVQLSGISADGSIPSALSTDTFGSGNAGELLINTKLLILKDGAAVSASTFGSGEGGRLTVNAREEVAIKSTNSNGFASGLYVQSLGDGDSRDLKIVVLH